MKPLFPMFLSVLWCCAVSLAFAGSRAHAADALRPASATAKPGDVEPGPKLVEYCKGKKGQQVGNGECWTLADEAFKAHALQRPGGALRVWGRVVDPKKERPEPGDIV